MQTPGLPILSRLIDTFPCVHKSWTVNVGYSWLNDVTIFWQSGGIEALDVGCGPATAGRPIRVAAGIGAPVDFGGGPKNNASGYVCVCVNLASTASGLCNDGVSTHTPVLQMPQGAAVNKD
jgi:hypothetical protein